MEIRFELASVADAEAFITVHNLAFYDDYVKYGMCPGYGRSEESLAEAIRNNLTYKIIIDGKIAGKLSFKSLSAAEWHVGCLCVIPAYQNTGVGQMAMTFMESQIPQGAEITLVTPADNARNVHFYEKCGYSCAGSMNDGVELYVMVKTL